MPCFNSIHNKLKGDSDTIHHHKKDNYEEESLIQMYCKEPTIKHASVFQLQKNASLGKSIEKMYNAHMNRAYEATQNVTPLPDQLKYRVEQTAGMPMDDIKVHYNSPKPDQLQALAYTQGSDIYMGRGQEKYLPHEAWHVVQQKQGRVKATDNMNGYCVNSSPELEHEADRFMNGDGSVRTSNEKFKSRNQKNVVQRVPKLILGRLGNTLNLSGGTGQKEKRILNIKGWKIAKNKEWIENGKTTGKRFNKYTRRVMSYEYDSNSPEKKDVGTKNRGIFKVIENIKEKPKNTLINNVVPTKQEQSGELDQLISDEYTAMTRKMLSNQKEKKFIYYVIKEASEDEALCRLKDEKKQPTVLAQEIQQLLDAKYIFKEVDGNKTPVKKHLMAFADQHQYEIYSANKRDRDMSKEQKAQALQRDREKE